MGENRVAKLGTGAHWGQEMPDFTPYSRLRHGFLPSARSIADRYQGMCDSRPYSQKSPAPGTRAMRASGDGFWELDLADGSAWFSDWFCARMQWCEAVRRPALGDLRPIMSSETWDALLRKLRSHLEEQSPLDTEFPVQLATGRVEWWHLRGSAQRGDGGLPTHFAGSVRDVTAARAAG